MEITETKPTMKEALTTAGIVTATVAVAIIVMKKRKPVSVDTAAAFMNMGNGNF